MTIFCKVVFYFLFLTIDLSLLCDITEANEEYEDCTESCVSNKEVLGDINEVFKRLVVTEKIVEKYITTCF